MANYVDNEQERLILRSADGRVARFLRTAGVSDPRKWIKENLARHLKRNAMFQKI